MSIGVLSIIEQHELLPLLSQKYKTQKAITTGNPPSAIFFFLASASFQFLPALLWLFSSAFIFC
jgi:hypothetical protein